MNEYALWLDVLLLGICDATGTFIPYDKESTERDSARAWFTDWEESDCYQPGTLPWVCEYLGIDPTRIANNVQALIDQGYRVRNNNLRPLSAIRLYHEPSNPSELIGLVRGRNRA